MGRPASREALERRGLPGDGARANGVMSLAVAIADDVGLGDIFHRLPATPPAAAGDAPRNVPVP